MSKDRGQWVPRALVIGGLALAQGSARPVEKVHASDVPLHPESPQWGATMAVGGNCYIAWADVYPDPIEGAVVSIAALPDTTEIPGDHLEVPWQGPTQDFEGNSRWPGSNEPDWVEVQTAYRPDNCETATDTPEPVPEPTKVPTTQPAATSTDTQQATGTASATSTAEATASSTSTASDTAQPTATETDTQTQKTPTPTPTRTSTGTATATTSRTATGTTPRATETLTGTASATASRTAVGTGTSTQEVIVTPTNTVINTEVPKTPQPTVQPTPSNTPPAANTPEQNPLSGGEPAPWNLSLLGGVVAVGGVMLGVGGVYVLTRRRQEVN